MEVLEERVVLFGGGGNGVLNSIAAINGTVLQVATVSGDTSNHLIRLQQDAANPTTQTDVLDNGSVAGTFNNSAFTQISVTLGSGNDTIDLGNVLPPPRGSCWTAVPAPTLLGWSSTATSWSLSGTNSGTSSNVTFHNIENLTGPSTGDTVHILPGGSLAGTFDGRGNGQLDYSGYNTGVTVNLQTGSATAFGAVANITSLYGSPFNDTLTTSNSYGVNLLHGGGGGDVLNGGSLGTDWISLDNPTSSSVVNGGSAATSLFVEGVYQSIWTVTGPNSGNVNGASFNHVASLQSGSTGDVFRIQSGGSLSGSITGGSTLDYSGYNAGVTVNLLSGAATGVSGGVTNMLNVVGSPYNDILTGNNSNNMLTGDGGSDTFSAGGIGNHTFVLSFGQTSSTVVTGGTGSDTLQENNGNYNTWNLTGANAGNVNGINFTHIANLSTTSGDRFCLVPGGSLSGNLNAGGGALDYSGYTSGVTVNLLTGLAPGLNTFSNVAIVIGTPSNDTLTGGNSNDTLNGNGGSDILNGGGSGNHTFYLSQAQATTTVVTGSSSNDTIVDFISNPAIQTNVCSITGANTGNVKGISFTHVANLVSESYDDFALLPGGSLTGTISGSGQLDYSGYNTGVTVNLLTGTATALGGVSAYLDLFGTPYNDTLTGGNTNDTIHGDGGTDSLNGGGSGNHSIVLDASTTSGTTVIGGSGSDTLFASTGGVSTWTVTGANAGNVNGINFTHIASLWSGSSADVFRIQSGGSLGGSIMGGSTLDYSGYNAGVTVNLNTGAATAVARGVSNILNVVGSPYNDTLTGNNSNNTLTGDGGSDTLKAGGSGNHTFVLSTGQFSTTVVTGGTGNDTLLDANTNPNSSLTNTWNITGANAGKVNGITFTNIENLAGTVSTVANDFVLKTNGSLTGTVSGYWDTLDYSADPITLSVTVAQQDSTGYSGTGTSIAGFSGIGTVVGSLSYATTTNTCTLTGGNFDSIFRIEGTNHGSFFPQGGSVSTGLAFSNMDILHGGSGNNIFRMRPTTNSNDPVDITGAISGSGVNTLDYTYYNAPVQLTLAPPTSPTATWLVGSGSGVNSFRQIQHLIGSTSSTNTLTGADLNTTWTLTGSNAGSMVAAGSSQNLSLDWQSFAYLVGGTSSDEFVFQTGGAVSGGINGGSSAMNWLNYTGYGATVTVNLANGSATQVANGANSAPATSRGCWAV